MCSQDRRGQTRRRGEKRISDSNFTRSLLPSSTLPLRRIVSRPSRHSITSRLKSSASSTPQCEQMSAKGGCKPRLFYLSVLLSSTSPIVKARLKSKNANSKNSKCCDRVLHVTEAENSFNNRPLGTVNCRACGLPLPQGGWIWRLDLQGRENRPQIVRILHANDQTDAWTVAGNFPDHRRRRSRSLLRHSFRPPSPSV